MPVVNLIVKLQEYRAFNTADAMEPVEFNLNTSYVYSDLNQMHTAINEATLSINSKFCLLVVYRYIRERAEPEFRIVASRSAFIPFLTTHNSCSPAAKRPDFRHVIYFFNFNYRQTTKA